MPTPVSSQDASQRQAPESPLLAPAGVLATRWFRAPASLAVQKPCDALRSFPPEHWHQLRVCHSAADLTTDAAAALGCFTLSLLGVTRLS